MMGTLGCGMAPHCPPRAIWPHPPHAVAFYFVGGFAI